MLTIELRFKEDGREISADSWADTLAAKLAGAVSTELGRGLHEVGFPQVRAASPNAQGLTRREPKAVGIAEAAKLLGLSSAAVRRFIAEERLHAVRLGRRVMVPMENTAAVFSGQNSPHCSRTMPVGL